MKLDNSNRLIFDNSKKFQFTSSSMVHGRSWYFLIDIPHLVRSNPENNIAKIVSLGKSRTPVSSTEHNLSFEKNLAGNASNPDCIMVSEDSVVVHLKPVDHDDMEVEDDDNEFNSHQDFAIWHLLNQKKGLFGDFYCYWHSFQR